MWKVAIAHFVLSILVLFLLNRSGRALRFSGHPDQLALLLFWRDMWQAVWDNTFLLLQPLLWAVIRFGNSIEIKFSDIDSIPITTLFLPSIPLWSFCFGWIFVKFDNWLNPFPVLGKRVF